MAALRSGVGRGSAPKARTGGGSGLATKLFAIALLVALVTAAGGAAVLTVLAPAEDRRGADDLTRSASAQTSLQRERLQRLQLTALELANDPALPELLAPPARGGAAAPAGEETEPAPDPVGEWLRRRRGGLGFDLALITDPTGRVVARSDRPPAFAETLAGNPLLAAPVPGGSPGERSGVWAAGGKLYLAASAPAVREFDLIATAVVAFAIDDLLALEIERMSGAEVAFVTADSAGGLRTVGASRGAAEAGPLVSALAAGGGGGRALREVLDGTESLGRAEIEAGGGNFEVLISPLRDAADRPAGAVVFSVPAAESGQLLPALVGLAVAAGVGLLVALPLIAWASRRAVGPVARLAAVLDTARRGDYGARIEARKAGPLGPVAVGLDGLLSDLRERQALAAVADAALGGGGEPAAALAAAEQRPMALLAVDMRRYALGPGGSDARETGERMARDLSRVESAVAARGGRVEAVFGQRALAAFEGDERAFRALAAGAEILGLLSREENAFDEVSPPALAVVDGKVVRGAATVGGEAVRTVAGTPVQLLDSLLREADAGELLLAPPVHRQLSDRFGEKGVAVEPRRGVLSPQPLYPLTAAAAARAAGVETAAGAPAEAPPSTAEPWTETPGSAVMAPGELGAGDRLGERFEIVALMGVSSAGSLFRARDRELGETVALKVFIPGEVADPSQFERLDSELQRVRRLVDSHVARTYDFGRAGGLGFIARERVAGVPIAEVLEANERLPMPAALRMIRQLAFTLAQAHGEGLTHGRLGPRNLILTPGGRLKVTDFGVGLVVRAAPGSADGDRWLAPELRAGRPATPRSDVYAAGALLLRLTTGAWPGSATGAADAVEGPGAAEVAAAVAAVAAGCLELEPEGRYADGAALVSALNDVRA